MSDEAFKAHHWYSRADENWTWVCAECGKVWKPILMPPTEECSGPSPYVQNMADVVEERSDA